MINPGEPYRKAVFPAQLERMGKVMEQNIFEFRIISLPDGTQIIDTTLKTPYDALTPLQMAEYIEMDVQIAIMERLERKAQREAERRRKLSGNLLQKVACLCGLF